MPPCTLCTCPSRLPEPGLVLSDDAQLSVFGWGGTERNELSSQLLQAQVQPLERQRCQRAFQPFGSVITERMMCLTGSPNSAGTCAGDSGGPAILRSSSDGQGGTLDDDATVLGFVSFGFPRAQRRACPRPNPATVFTDLRNPEVNAWVRRVVQRFGDDPVTQLGGVDGGLAGPPLRPLAQQSVTISAASGLYNADFPQGDAEYEPLYVE